jgi:hypothetical protein
VSQAQWIGPRPSAIELGAILFVGTIGILIPGVQPIVLGALLEAQHIDLAQLGHASTSELLCMGGGAALAAALLAPRHLRAIGFVTSLVMAAGNWATPYLSGETVTVMRAVTGAAGGILIWVTSCMIARSSTPDRWAAIWLAVQTLAQLLFGFAMSDWAQPLWGAVGDFQMLALGSVIAAAASLLLPRAFVDLPKSEHATSASGIPSLRGVAGLLVGFLFMMFIVSVWVYYEPIARDAGLSSKVSDNATLLSLGCQVLGATTAAVFAGRLRWYPILIGCAILDLGLVWILGTRPSEALFLIDAAVFGFIWLFILPVEVPMLIEADPSRRAAVLNGGVNLLGGSLGPSIAAELVAPDNMRGALWLAAGCLVLCVIIATALKLVIRPRAV